MVARRTSTTNLNYAEAVGSSPTQNEKYFCLLPVTILDICFWSRWLTKSLLHGGLTKCGLKFIDDRWC